MIFENFKKALILKTMAEYKIPKGIIPTEEPVIENKLEVEAPIEENKESFDEIIGEYTSVTEFMVTVSTIMEENKIDFNLKHVVPVFKLFGEYEDKFIKISYDEGTKQGIINIKE